MTKLLSPAAQKIKDAVLATYADNIPKDDNLWALERASTVAALRAAADHIRTIGPWVGHIDSPGLDWAVLEIASIATELENHV
jgi:hypothetical protein